MVWDKVLSSETDADSPLNQDLFEKLRNNLDAIVNDIILFSAYKGECLIQVTSEECIASADIPDQAAKTEVFLTKIYIPSWVDTLQIYYHHMFEAGGTNNECVSAIDNDGAGGSWNLSDPETIPVGAYGYDVGILPTAGSFVGAGGLRQFRVRVKQQGGGGNKDYFLRALIVKGRTAT